jgi:hypothetical protein
MANEIVTQPVQRYRGGGYGAMVESEIGGYVRVDDVRELLELLHAFAVNEDKPLVKHVIGLLGERP